MKKILAVLAVAVIFAACKMKTNENDNTNMVLVDTTGLSKNNILVYLGQNRYVTIEKPVIPEPPVRNISASGKNKANPGTNYYSGTGNTSNASYPQDKGWSHAAKGTVVGAGTGAITGAILNKEHRGRGAIIGAIIGAGSGYIIGRTTDKKTGRVDRAKARKAATNQ